MPGWPATTARYHCASQSTSESRSPHVRGRRTRADASRRIGRNRHTGSLVRRRIAPVRLARPRAVPAAGRRGRGLRRGARAAPGHGPPRRGARRRQRCDPRRSRPWTEAPPRRRDRLVDAQCAARLAAARGPARRDRPRPQHVPAALALNLRRGALVWGRRRPDRPQLPPHLSGRDALPRRPSVRGLRRSRRGLAGRRPRLLSRLARPDAPDRGHAGHAAHDQVVAERRRVHRPHGVRGVEARRGRAAGRSKSMSSRTSSRPTRARGAAPARGSCSSAGSQRKRASARSSTRRRCSRPGSSSASSATDPRRIASAPRRRPIRLSGSQAASAGSPSWTSSPPVARSCSHRSGTRAFR